MSFQWSREGGSLPAGRSEDTGFGLLVLTSVEVTSHSRYLYSIYNLYI